MIKVFVRNDIDRLITLLKKYKLKKITNYSRLEYYSIILENYNLVIKSPKKRSG